MAFSGTVSATVFDTRKVIESAARRCKVRPQVLTTEHVEIANNELFLLLSSLANKGVQLWCLERQIYPLYDGVNRVVLDVGTVDTANTNLRTLEPVTGTDTDSATQRETVFATSTLVSTIGIKWSAASAPIAIERSDDGASWTQVQTQTPTASAGEWTWYDLDSVVASLYIRVRATSGTLDFERIFYGNSPTEIELARINRDDYTNLPNQVFKSDRPTQFWFDRQVRQPVLRLWPSPNAAAETSQVIVWRERHIQDVGSMTQELEVPQRWYDAIVADLAYRLCMEFAEASPDLIPLLKSVRDEAMYHAQQEERDDSPMKILPNISPYTA